MKKIKENEWLAIEPYITGYYEKFVSNTNKTKKDIGKAIPAFMHWNWVFTRGEKVVSDVQGVIKNNYYHLTDPAVQSINSEYGLTDLGAYGILVFLAKHKHNEFCENLPWPNSQTINMLKAYHIVSNEEHLFLLNLKKLQISEIFILKLKMKSLND